MAATAIPRPQNGWIERMGQRFDAFWSMTPGIRDAGELRVAVFSFGYALLFLGLTGLLIFVPLIGFAAAFAFATATGGWGAREVLSSRLAVLRSPNAVIRVGSWLGIGLAFILVGLPLVLVTSTLAIIVPLAALLPIVVSLAALAWWIVWRERGSVPSRVLRSSVAIVLTPLALAIWYVWRAKGWLRLAVVVAIWLWPYTLALLVFQEATYPTTFGDGTLGPLLVFAVAESAIACLFVLSLAIRIADRFCPADVGVKPGGEMEGIGGIARSRFSLLAAGDVVLWLAIRFVLWAAVQLAFLVPWIFVVRSLDSETQITIYIFAGIAVFPMAGTSLVALFQGLERQQLKAGEWVEQYLGAALGTSLLLALGTSVTFAALSSAPLVSEIQGNAPNGLPYTGVMAAVAGLNIGLSLRIAKVNAFRMYWAYATSAASLGLVLIGALLFIAIDSSMKSPNSSDELAHAFGLSVIYLAVAVLGVIIGLVVSGLVHPGLRAFAGAMSGLLEMVKPLIGFVCGYALIVLTFGAAYYAIYLTYGGFDCSTSGTAVVDCRELRPDQHPVAESDFMFFSINTALPLGYSRIKPADYETHLQWLAAAELMVGTSWVVIVFAAMLHTIQARMVGRITASEIDRLKGGAAPI